MDFRNRVLTCLDCNQQFLFTAGEQLFFYQKQFTNEPKRCTRCKIRRAAIMGFVRGGPSVRIETHTQCSECNQRTTVPFRPTQGRPVLCRGCFLRARILCSMTSDVVSAGMAVAAD